MSPDFCFLLKVLYTFFTCVNVIVELVFKAKLDKWFSNVVRFQLLTHAAMCRPRLIVHGRFIVS